MTTQPAADSFHGSSSAPSIASLRSALLNTSGSTSLDARFRALFTLKGLAAASPSQTEEVVSAIGEGFRDDSALLKHELAYVLGQIGDTSAIPVLESVLGDLKEDPMVRHEAAEALGAISSPSVLPLLQSYLTDADVSVRETCELAIQKIQWDDSEEGREARRRREAVREKMKEGGREVLVDGEDGLVLGPVDPAPAITSTTSSTDVEISNSTPAASPERIPSLRTMLASPTLPLWSRYRAMFSLRDIVLSSVRSSQGPTPTAAERDLCASTARAAIDALAHGLQVDRGAPGGGSALFRHEICFVFGELVRPESTKALLGVLQDEGEHEMVRHEAAEALGGIIEEGDEAEADAADLEVEAERKDIASTPPRSDVLSILQHYASDASSPRVVRESCVVALDELAYNNDPTQFQRVEVA